jgi:hypothetical protein
MNTKSAKNKSPLENTLQYKNIFKLSLGIKCVEDKFVSDKFSCEANECESFAASTVTEDHDNTIKDLCAICYGNPQRTISFCYIFLQAMRYFMCETSHYHNKITEHTYIRSVK